MTYISSVAEREELIAAIRLHADAIRKLGVTGLHLFGSRARGDHRPDSDLDIFVDYDRAARFSLVKLASIKSIIQNATGLKVHIITRNSFRPYNRKRLEQHAVKVF